MSEREVQQMALSQLQRQARRARAARRELRGACQCQVIISDGVYVVPRETLPDRPTVRSSIFYRDDRGNVAR
jgi:hypothetical protein